MLLLPRPTSERNRAMVIYKMEQMLQIIPHFLVQHLHRYDQNLCSNIHKSSHVHSTILTMAYIVTWIIFFVLHVQFVFLLSYCCLAFTNKCMLMICSKHNVQPQSKLCKLFYIYKTSLRTSLRESPQLHLKKINCFWCTRGPFPHRCSVVLLVRLALFRMACAISQTNHRLFPSCVANHSKHLWLKLMR